VNLAEVVRDGDRIYIPHAGQPIPSVVSPSGAGPPAAAGATSSASVPSEPIDLNRATADQLDALPGIGPSTAAAIVSYRDRVGPFSSVDGLLQVPGIGPAKLDLIRSLVRV